MESKTPSKLILDLGEKIEKTSGAKLKFIQDSTAPVQEWIPKNQMSPTKVITLRTAKQTRRGSAIKLHQFNPNFFLVEPSGISCRVPRCERRPSQLKLTRSSERIKQDLFLCENHRKQMATLVSQRCEKENISLVSFATYKHEDLNGYTYLIGQLEKAFMHLKPAILNVRSQLCANRDLQLAEVFLNVRNYLIITNALLNPNDDNMDATLPACLVILGKILDCNPDPNFLRYLLKDIMDIILNFFGVIYAWVFLANPGAQVGAGVGLFLGGIGAVLFGFPPVGIIGSVFLGFIGGKLIGGGGYECYQQQREIDRLNQREREYIQFICEQFGQASHRLPRYHVPASPDGDIVLNLGDGPLDID